MEEVKFEVLYNVSKPPQEFQHFRRTRPVLSRFELAHVLAIRTEQIARGTIPLVERNEGEGPSQLAERELQSRLIPFIIRRYLPNGRYEDWKIEELEICDNRIEVIKNF